MTFLLIPSRCLSSLTRSLIAHSCRVYCRTDLFLHSWQRDCAFLCEMADEVIERLPIVVDALNFFFVDVFDQICNEVFVDEVTELDTLQVLVAAHNRALKLLDSLSLLISAFSTLHTLNLFACFILAHRSTTRLLCRCHKWIILPYQPIEKLLRHLAQTALHFHALSRIRVMKHALKCHHLELSHRLSLLSPYIAPCIVHFILIDRDDLYRPFKSVHEATLLPHLLLTRERLFNLADLKVVLVEQGFYLTTIVELVVQVDELF